MLTWLLRFVLVYWLFSVIWRWIGGGLSGGGRKQAEPKKQADDHSNDILHSGSIEDADFEDIDNRES